MKTPSQTHVLGLAHPPLPMVRLAFIGLGNRGVLTLQRYLQIEGVEIKALCEIREGNLVKAQKILREAGYPQPDGYTGPDGWKRMCERDDIDLVFICTDWLTHTPMAVYSMEHGKHVAIEVPAAMTVEECWKLVDTAEKTRQHCMMLENCVYDFFELTTLNMARHGLFGEILHVEGSYIHNLDEFWDYYQGNWRLDFDQKHRGDVYATHGLGPACQLLGIHRGDKMDYLVSMSSDQFGLTKRAGVVEAVSADEVLIKTEKGRTIHLQHNVYTPRPYSRMYQLTGTEGFANKYPVEGYAFRAGQLAGSGVPDHENLSEHSFIPEEAKAALMEQYKDPIVRDIEDKAREVGGHGGMDFIMDYRLIYCLRNGLPLDQDVYDAAEWSSLVELTEASAEHGGMPVLVPDFTRGAWDKVKGFSHAVK